ncbi:MAG: holo-ACP synthase [Chitinispirillaceae bacterium]|nr:holo-ACP synthase [Chitinispirillaceae bacterium]
MIKGIGVDLVEIQRIEECIRMHGDHFLKKVFTEQEIGYCGGKKRPAVHFAGRWAAKEAFFKALPRKCQAVASWKSVQIIVSDRGGPAIDVCSVELAGLARKAGIKSFNLSISHERFLCVAFVVAE